MFPHVFKKAQFNRDGEGPGERPICPAAKRTLTGASQRTIIAATQLVTKK